MNEYDVKRGHQANVAPEKLREHMRDIFGNAEQKDDKLVSAFGALKEIRVWSGGKNALCVETEMDPGVPDDVAAKTIKAYNQFLERATGFNAKERGKRAQKKAKQGKA